MFKAAITDAFTIDLTTEAAAVAYAAANITGKAEMRAAMKAAITDAIMSDDFATAKHLAAIEKAAFVANRPARAEIDWTARVADLRATLLHAVEMIDNGNVTFPESVDTPELGDITGGTVDAKLATKFATVSGRKGARGSVAAYVDSVLGDTPMTVAELRAAWVASEDYPQAAPSAGAIAAMLDRDNTDGITVTDVNGTKAAVRV